MAAHHRGKGISEAVGFLLILAVVIVTLSIYLMYLVPAMGREGEISQMAAVKERLTEYKLNIDSLWTSSLCTTAFGPALSLGTGTDTGILSFFPFLSPAKGSAVLALNQRAENITITSSSLLQVSSWGATGTGLIGTTSSNLALNTVPLHFYVNMNTSDLLNQRGVHLIGPTWDVWMNTTPNYYYYTQANLTLNQTRGGTIETFWFTRNSTLSGTDITLSTNINNLPVVNNLVIYKSIGANKAYPVDLMSPVYGVSTSFKNPQSLGISASDTFLNATYLINYGYTPQTYSTTWPMGSIEFRSDNVYYTPQTYYYQMGGVFLEQSDGSSAEVPPSISISMVNSSPVVKIGEILIQGSVTDTNMSGSGPIMVTTAVTNMAAVPLVLGNNSQWVNVTIQAASNNSAVMWNRTFYTLASQGGVPSSSFTTGVSGNMAFMNITGDPTTYSVQLSLTQVNVSADYQIENTFGGLSRSWQSVPGFAMAGSSGSSGSGTGSLDLQVAASTDDCFRWYTSNPNPHCTGAPAEPDYVDNWQLNVPRSNTSVRFTGVTVPQGATITTAYLTFRAEYTQATPGGGTIRGQYSDNAQTFIENDKADYDGRPRTTNSAHWAPSVWTADTDYTSPELKSIVQEIVNRPGWTSGNAMAFFIEHDTSVYTAAYSYDTGPTYAPKLHIGYTP